MLVLTRRLDEEIVIGGTIRVRVVAVRGNKVRLGITAPGQVTVVRQELIPRQSNPPPASPHPEAEMRVPVTPGNP
jgi:carbon storage regulator CsrA